MARELSLKSLNREDALLCLEVRRFMEEELGLGPDDLTGTTVLAAFSGGADSTALLVMLHVLAPHMGFCLRAAHLDHALRPESAAEAVQAEALCRDLGISFVSVRRDVAALAREWGCGVEEAARRARYDFLNEQGCRWIATGHHAGDLAEDMLLRLTRGAMWPALGGMDGLDRARGLMRPLLMQDKARLVKLLVSLGIRWAEDASNASLDYKRNRMRHQLLPLMLAENPSFYDVARKLWRSAARERAWLAQALPGLQEGCLLLPRPLLEGMSPALRLQALAESLRRVGGHPLHENLLRLERAFSERRNGKTLQFPGARVQTRREGLLFSPNAGSGENPF